MSLRKDAPPLRGFRVGANIEASCFAARLIVDTFAIGVGRPEEIGRFFGALRSRSVKCPCVSLDLLFGARYISALDVIFTTEPLAFAFAIASRIDLTTTST